MVLGIGLIVLVGVVYFNSQLLVVNVDWVKMIVFLIVLVVMVGVIYWMVGCNCGVVDFMIVIEGEMKKVNWLIKCEIIGLICVVIFMLLVFVLVLFVVDVIFMVIFSLIDILQVNVWEILFGVGD